MFFAHYLRTFFPESTLQHKVHKAVPIAIGIKELTRFCGYCVKFGDVRVADK